MRTSSPPSSAAVHFRHKYWHFIDEPFTADGTALKQPVPPNAQTQVAIFKKTLADTTESDEKRSYDLAWLLHLVGDLHQPLHATSRFTHAEPDGDAGGNDVKITCTKCGGAKELHALWDGLLGPTDGPPQDAIAAATNLRQVDAGSTDENDWIQESFKSTHPTSAVLPDAGYFAKRVTLSLALRSSGDAGRGVGRVGAAPALVAG